MEILAPTAVTRAAQVHRPLEARRLATSASNYPREGLHRWLLVTGAPGSDLWPIWNEASGAIICRLEPGEGQELCRAESGPAWLCSLPRQIRII